jgi:hypothetical protein
MCESTWVVPVSDSSNIHSCICKCIRMYQDFVTARQTNGSCHIASNDALHSTQYTLDTNLQQIWAHTRQNCEELNTSTLRGRIALHLNLSNISEISGSHGEYKDDSILWYSTVRYRRSRPTFQRCVLSPSSRRWRQYAPLKSRSNSTRLHRAISHKGVIFILVVRTWNLTQTTQDQT